MQKKIIVGYDGSSFAEAALTWALDEADRTGSAVEMLYARNWPETMVPSMVVRPEDYGYEIINGTMTDAVTRAKKTHPLIDVATAVTDAHAATALVERSGRALMIVIGARGHSAVAGLLGSVSSAVTAHARCPVVVVRGDPASNTPVVAGVDDSAASPAVLDFAARQATSRRVPLRIVHAWPPVSGLWAETAMVTGTVTEPEREHFDALVRSVQDIFGGLEIEDEALVDHPAAALTSASATAQLVVVGSRGRGAVRGLLLGSVSQHLLRHSACTVAVIHDSAGQH